MLLYLLGFFRFINTLQILDTDVWFYAIDPATQTLLALNESMTVEKITGKQASTSLKYIVTGDLHVQVSLNLVKAKILYIFGRPAVTDSSNIYLGMLELFYLNFLVMIQRFL